MTFYWIYEVAFPVGLGLVGALCISFALAGLALRRPLLYSSRIPLLGFFAFLTPMFLISLRHIIAPPYFSGYGIYLNSVLCVVYPILAYYSVLASKGYTVLGLSPRRVRRVLKEESQTPFRVIGFPLLAMSLVLPPKGEQSDTTKTELQIILGAAPPQLRFNTLLFMPTLALGLIMASSGYWSWCYSTECSEGVINFTQTMAKLKPRFNR